VPAQITPFGSGREGIAEDQLGVQIGGDVRGAMRED